MRRDHFPIFQGENALNNPIASWRDVGEEFILVRAQRASSGIEQHAQSQIIRQEAKNFEGKGHFSQIGIQFNSREDLHIA